MREPIYNSTTSINKYFELELKPELETIYGSSICIYFEDQQKQSFPNITINHPIIGDTDNKVNNFSNDIIFHLNIPKSKDNLARKMIDKFYDFTGLKVNNVSKFVQIPVFDYDLDPIVRLGCMRLYINSGFRRMPVSDPTIRHYMADLSIYYS